MRTPVLVMSTFLALSAPVAVFASGPGAPSVQELPPPLRESLKDAQPANFACRMNDPLISADQPLSRKAERADYSCAIALDQLASSQAANVVLVDIRSKAQFDAMHIDGAANFPDQEIRTKHYLASKDVVLIGDGKRDQALYGLCGALKADGFKRVRVLQHGMAAWASSNRPTVGKSADLVAAISLSAPELFQNASARGTMLIGLPRARPLGDVLAGMRIAADNSVAALVAEVLRVRKQFRGAQTLVVVADEHFGDADVAELVRLTQPDPVLVYAGSAEEYRQFMRTQAALWAKQAKGPAKPRCGAL